MSDLESHIDLPEPSAAPPVPPATAGAGSGPPRPKSRAGAFVFGAFSGCLVVLALVFFVGVVVAVSGGDSGQLKFSTNKVAVVPIDGEILDARETLEALHKYADNSLVRAIVVRIDSPGGAIAPSQEIYEAIRKIRQQSGKPVVASLDSVAASGGFYIAVGCDRIVANPGSITGSIGVIMQWMDMKDLLTWARLKPETITSGAMKAAGSPYQQLTAAERQYLQNIVTELHGQFVRAVAEGRKGKISAAEVARIADGRVFTGEQALSLKLVDDIGNFDDAVKVAADLAGIHGKPVVIYPRKHPSGLLGLLSGSNDSEAAIQRILGGRTPRFLYRW
jgi:protease-4